MGMIGKVIRSSVATNKDSPGKVLLLEVEISEADDIQTVEHIRLSGIDCTPPKDSHVIIDDIGNFQAGVAVDDGIEPETNEGEIEIYGSLAGIKTSKVKCGVGGNVEINEGSRNAAGQNHEITITPDTDPTFFAWLTAVAEFTSIKPAPTSVTGKISEGATTVKIP